MKILTLCDSPTLTTGFARVAQNIFKGWAKRGVKIDCWGIGFTGWHYRLVGDYVNNLFPAGLGGEWCGLDRLGMFLSVLANGGYDAVWIMQDSFLLSASDFPSKLREICTAKSIRSMYYFPVDAPLEPGWTDMIAAVDVPVAYTEYGKQEAFKSLNLQERMLQAGKVKHALNFTPEIAVLPHGVDTKIYQPKANRRELRHKLYEKSPWLKDDDFVILNVNANQSRKDIPRSLELLKLLRKEGVPAKLVLHMHKDGGYDQLMDLDVIGRQLGLPGNEAGENRVWGHHGTVFANGSALSQMTEAALVEIYNMADLVLTTTLGEGWGLSITEALACGTPVAMPEHTSCAEIHDHVAAGLPQARQTILLPLELGSVVHRLDNGRTRRRVDLVEASKLLIDYYQSGKWVRRVPLTESADLEQWLSWDRIATEMLRLMKKKAAMPAPQVPKQSMGGLEVCAEVGK